MSKKKKYLVVKPLDQIDGIDTIHELNLEVMSLAIVSQVQLEKFDKIADFKNEFNGKFKTTAINHLRNTEFLQERIYDEYYADNQTILTNTEDVYSHVVKLLLLSSIEDIYDLLGLIITKKIDPEDYKTQIKSLLVKHNEEINKQLNPTS